MQCHGLVPIELMDGTSEVELPLMNYYLCTSSTTSTIDADLPIKRTLRLIWYTSGTICVTFGKIVRVILLLDATEHFVWKTMIPCEPSVFESE